MPVAVVDIGTNSTRLLIATVEDGRVTAELARESRVTRLGQGVDASGELAPEAMDRVFAVLADYRAAIDAHGVTETVAVLTSAVRDASNGAQFTQAVRDRYGLDAREIPGTEEAQLTFLGATSERDPGADDGEIVVVDIGGGSTEFVAGRGGEVSFFTSLQMGVVRQTERHLRHDPPRADELEALSAEVARTIMEGVPAEVRERVSGAIAVAGTATSLASIDQGLEPYDPAKVHGYVLTPAILDRELRQLASLPNEDRRNVPGLHPDRAPTIVAGVATLRQVMQVFGLAEVEVSEHDILRGAALRRAGAPTPD